MWTFLAIVLAFFFVRIYNSPNSPEAKGKHGERKVYNILKRLSFQYIIFNDVTLKTSFGLTQIDHIVISVFGIFVIETKRYTGDIYGTQQSERWVKNVYGNKYYFRNPVKQNYAHVKAIEELTKLTNEQIKAIVVFDDVCSLNVTTSDTVIYFSELENCIAKFTQEILTIQEVEYISNSILRANIVDGEEKSRHIKDVQEKIIEYNFLKSKMICPKCKNTLVVRKGKYGDFYGCSNYPYCKFTENID